jgi:hypothetical protein
MLCPICERETKLVLHILWSCSSAQDVWGCGPMKFPKGCNTGVNFTQWFEEMMGRCSLEELELLIEVARWMWFRRNSVVHEGEFTHSNQVFKEALIKIEDFKRFNALEQNEQALINATPPTFWQPPPLDKVKVNWDAAMNKKHGRRDIGFVTRDSKGFILATRSTTQRIVLEPIVVEVVATLHAVIFSKEIGFSDIILEGDALQIIQ